MRENRRLRARPGALRRHAAVWVVVASLFASFLGQPLHAAEPSPDSAVAASSALAPTTDGSHAAQAASHDADLCSICRASAQTRLGLRAAVRAGEIASQGPAFALLLPAPAPAQAAPLLRRSQPRAPPSPLPLLFV